MSALPVREHAQVRVQVRVMAVQRQALEGPRGCMALGPGQIPGSLTLTVDALTFKSEPPGLVVIRQVRFRLI